MPAQAAPSSLVNIRVNGIKSPECGRADFRLLNLETGEVRPVRCERWDCPVCGKINAWQWSNRVEVAKPRRFIMLSNIGANLDEAWLSMKLFNQTVRREGIRFECFYVPELTPDHKLLHCHMLEHGWDWSDQTGEGGYIRQAFLSDAARRAGMGSYVWIQALSGVRNVSAYAMKNVMGYTFKGSSAELWADNPGRRRVRYTRGFFPSSVAEIDAQLKAEHGAGGQWVLQVKSSRGVWSRMSVRAKEAENE